LRSERCWDVADALRAAGLTRGERPTSRWAGMLVGYWTIRVRVVVRVAPKAEAVSAIVEVPAGVPVVTTGDAFVQALAMTARKIGIENVNWGAFILVGRNQRHVVDRRSSASIRTS
jgi:hypothetical protein